MALSRCCTHKLKPKAGSNKFKLKWSMNATNALYSTLADSLCIFNKRLQRHPPCKSTVNNINNQLAQQSVYCIWQIQVVNAAWDAQKTEKGRRYKLVWIWLINCNGPWNGSSNIEKLVVILELVFTVAVARPGAMCDPQIYECRCKCEYPKSKHVFLLFSVICTFLFCAASVPATRWMWCLYTRIVGQGA